MASATLNKQRIHYGEFEVEVTRRNQGLNLPQRMGKLMWAPMFLMGVMAFPAVVVLGIVRAAVIDSGNNTATAAVLGQLIPGVLFLGVTATLSAIVFAIARILGAFREGGGGVQETAGRRVLTLVMPWTAKAMLGLMIMGMMMLLFSVISQFVMASVIGNAVLDRNQGTLGTIESWAIWQEGLRRLGVVVYLVSIALGLATIVQVIRLQSKRIRELASEEPTA